MIVERCASTSNLIRYSYLKDHFVSAKKCYITISHTLHGFLSIQVFQQLPRKKVPGNQSRIKITRRPEQFYTLTSAIHAAPNQTDGIEGVFCAFVYTRTYVRWLWSNQPAKLHTYPRSVEAHPRKMALQLGISISRVCSTAGENRSAESEIASRTFMQIARSALSYYH